MRLSARAGDSCDSGREADAFRMCATGQSLARDPSTAVDQHAFDFELVVQDEHVGR